MVQKFFTLLVLFVIFEVLALTQAFAKEPKPLSLSSKNESVTRAKKTIPTVKPTKKYTTPVWPVPGIYATPNAKDLGKMLEISGLYGIKIRAWLDGYLEHNFNNPSESVVNANQSLSIIKGNDITIEGRTFDVHSDQLDLSLAEVELEKIPERGKLGFKLDLAAGTTQEILADTIAGSLGSTTRAARVVEDFKNIQHASLSFILPLKKGIRFDVGKFVTHIGAETIETVKNWNYSHSYLYSYAIPFQDTGVHINYPWTSNFYTDFYVINGWNTIVDNNSHKTIGPSVGWTITPWLAFVANYLTGPEQNNNNTNTRQLFDTQITLGPFLKRWTFIANYDYGYEQNAINNNSQNTHWQGVAGYGRYKINDMFEPSLRIEYYDDPDGFTTGVPQHLMGYTLTWNTQLVLGPHRSSLILLRPEIRYDRSSTDFFTYQNNFRSKQSQWTVGIGTSWII